MKIIGECGINWSTIEEAKLMISKCKEIGVDYAKSQLFNNDLIKHSVIYDELKKRILTYEDAKELFDYGKGIGQKVFFTPMFEEAVDWCEDIGVELYKIRHKDRNNISLMKRVFSTEQSVFMSIDRQYLRPRIVNDNLERINFLLCIPVKLIEGQKVAVGMNEYALNKGTFCIFSGISDHTKGTELLLKAKELGALLFEKHVMLDNTHPPEEGWSIEFSELGKILK